MTAKGPQGPNDSEIRMLRVYDTFTQVLETQPAKARQMSKALEEVAQQFAQPQPKGQTK